MSEADTMSEADQHAQRILTQKQKDTYYRCVNVLEEQYKPEYLERRKCRLILKIVYENELSLKRVNETWSALKWLPVPLIIMENIGWLQTFSSFYREANLSDETHQMVYEFLNKIINPDANMETKTNADANMETKTYSKRSPQAFHVGVALETLKFFKMEVNKMTRDMLDKAFGLKRSIKDAKQVCINIANRTRRVTDYDTFTAYDDEEKKDKQQKAVLDRQIREWERSLYKLKRSLQ